jgi:hypothetical protein
MKIKSMATLRANICKACDKRSELNICLEFDGDLMQKILAMQSSCPLGKWKRSNGNEIEAPIKIEVLP